MAKVHLEPTASQVQSVIDYLQEIPSRVFLRGSDLASAAAVQRLWWRREGKTLCAKVQGTHLYTQIMELKSGSIGENTCSCPQYMDCKHVAAALITYSNGWSGEGADLDKTDHDYGPDDEDSIEDDVEEEDDGYDDEDELSVAAIAKVLTSLSGPPKKVAIKYKAAKALPDQNILAHALATRLGRKLTASEQKRTALIDQIYQNNTPNATVDLLMAIAGQPKSYRYFYDSPVTLWPSRRPPATVLEAWLYTAHALRRKYPSLNAGPLFSDIPVAEIDRLVAPWLREEAIKSWQHQLTLFNQAPDTLPPAFPAFRLRLHPEGAQVEWCQPQSSIWELMKTTPLRQYSKAAWSSYPDREPVTVDDDAIRFLRAVCPQDSYGSKGFIEKSSPQFITALNRLLRIPAAASSVLTPDGRPFPTSPDPAAWTLDGPHFPLIDHDSGPGPDPATAGDYFLTIRKSDNTPLPDLLAILPGHPNLAVTPHAAYPLPGPPHPADLLSPGQLIPAAAVESPIGLAVLDRLRIPLPARINGRVKTVKVAVTVRCAHQTSWNDDTFKVQATASSGGLLADEVWMSGGWKSAGPVVSTVPAPEADTLTRLDRSLQHATHAWLTLARLSAPPRQNPANFWMERPLVKGDRTSFPDEFLAWLEQRPEGIIVELDPDLAALRDQGKVTGSFQLDLEETGIDWFDLSLNLQLSDVELSQKEIDLLLKHTGSWVRLPGRGWRKLEFEITDETQQQLADLGLSPGDLHSNEKQRLHVLQLAHPASGGLLPAGRGEEVRRRAADLRTTVSPDLPAGITADLRPYQLDGYHFLAYLSTNRFGGILADDMGLGKTLQALTWLAWLHESSQLDGKPILVVCPKSVQDNWTSEATKFYPALPVRQWTSATAGDLENLTAHSPAKPHKKRGKAAAPDSGPAAPAAPPLLLIINYTQLRLHADALSKIHWSTVILDEAQYIKNPTSITARTACGLTAGHRLALSGTPIENRLLDLWSIMAFAMPGILGNRTHFAKTFDAKDDPHARRRLGARVRPFLLRRTKKEVAADLPDRIEEDLICTLEGPQQEHYMAELKHARSTLLKAKTSDQLDKLRFNILTSLLRLRQICCHPILTGRGATDAGSAKLDALLELLEPLIDEGHKVLIFSQFVEMLHLIRTALTERAWPHLLLTGATEDRGALVKQFQESEGANCFLISLKAGGSGLNLTAASYVVLFDPWWNPAVENQAIDRTHRIGQVNKVIAYRLITRDTIEEKIRQLQKTKSALAGDILGEETFAKALTLDDFQFLLGS